MKPALNDRFIKGLKPAPAGTREEHMDTVVPGFGVRVTDKGAKSYFLIKRVPGVRNKTRRTIASVGAVALKDARQTAREWLEQITEGSDPKAVAQARAGQAAAAEGMGFVRVVEDFIAERLNGQRKGAEVARDLRREFGRWVDGKPSGPWASKRVDEIEPSDVADIIRTVAKRAPHQARNVLGYVSRVFDWAVSTGKIKYSPCASVKPKALLGEKEASKAAPRQFRTKQALAWGVLSRLPVRGGLPTADPYRPTVERGRGCKLAGVRY